jgi:hypothetical protein
VAVPSSHNGSDLVLKTGRPVLFLGGFSGSDPVVNASSLASLVSSGQLKYILYARGSGFGSGSSDALGDWIQRNCRVVDALAQGGASSPRNGFAQSTLYQCGKS